MMLKTESICSSPAVVSEAGSGAAEAGGENFCREKFDEQLQTDGPAEPYEGTDSHTGSGGGADSC